MVVSNNAKEATLGILSDSDFFQEGCLAGQALRMAAATAMTDCDLLRIDKKAMMAVLHRERALSDMFVAYLLTRNTTFQFEREEAGANPSAAGSFWKSRRTRDRGSQDQPGDTGGNDRYNPLAGQLLHE